MRQPVIGEVRVQEVVRSGGRRTYTVVGADGSVLSMPDGFLRTCEPGTSRTYAYQLADHLRWLAFEALSAATVTVKDLRRYMAALGAEVAGPYGRPWRVDRLVMAAPSGPIGAA